MIIDSGYQRFKVDNTKIELLDRKKNQFLKFDVVAPVLKKIIKNKTVLDIGASNGLYSYFCALNGANHVVALENGKLSIGGANIKILEKVCERHKIKNIIPINQCFTKYHESSDIVLAFAIMHHLLYDTLAYPELKDLIKHLSDITNEKLLIEWVDVSVGGPYSKRQRIYTKQQFIDTLGKYFLSVKEIGITNTYPNEPKRPPRITYLCKKTEF